MSINLIEANKIINDTYSVFSKTTEQLLKFKNLPKLDNSLYTNLHTDFLVPTDILIDVDLFNSEIQQYDNEFSQWGTMHTSLPRYGLALVNIDGKLTKDLDPINGSLYQYNLNNPVDPLFETDCTIPTEVYNLKCLEPLKVLDGYYTRSNIFKWLDTAKFLPHIDTFMPTPWLRLWGTTNSENLIVNYYNKNTDKYECCNNIENGRIYLTDTTLVHDAICTGGINYQFFLSTNIHAYNIISTHIMK
jgi:hypothetical protein